MKKTLSDLTLEELWTLFPIELTAHDEHWPTWFLEEKLLLQDILSDQQIIRIAHIGSTAIQHIWTKPIIDILVELDAERIDQHIIDLLTAAGYLLMQQSDQRASLNKGYTLHGFADQVYHVHLRLCNDHDELYFRDYLKEHPETAQAYEALKLELWPRFKHDRDGYTAQITAFVSEISQQAKACYPKRYDKKTVKVSE